MNTLAKPVQLGATWSVRLGATLRTGRWPDRTRLPVFAAFILVAYARMMWHVFGEATGHVGSDFLAFWGAGRLVLAGTPQASYDLAAEHAAQWASHTGQMVAYVNPPPYLFLTAPLGLLSFSAAWLVWALGGWAAWAWLCRRLLPDAPLAVVASPVAYLAACHAQNGFVTGMLLIGGVMLLGRPGALRRHEWAAGALFGLLIIKPHLALLVPVWLIAGGRWRAVLGAAGSASALCLLALAVFGWATWAAWPHSFQVSAALLAQDGGPFFARMATPYALLRIWLGSNVALAGQAVITLALAGLVWRATRSFGVNAGTGALMLAATCAASPYLFSYDLPFLIQPVLWLVARARAQGWRQWEKPTVIALWLAPLATRAMALPLDANLMPFAALVLIVLICTRLRRDQLSIKG